MEVKTAARTLAIFETFGRLQRPLTLAELARLMGTPSSSCLYIVRTLEQSGFLYRTGAGKAYYPTRKMLSISTSISEGEPVLEKLIPLLETLRDESKETVIIGKTQGTKIVYLAILDGTETMRFAARAGDARSIHATAGGKALFAALPSAQQLRLIDKIDFTPSTEYTISDRETFLVEIAGIVERGYSISRSESARGVMAIAKTVSVNAETYAVSIVGLAERMGHALDEQVERLTTTCRAIEEFNQLQGGSNWGGN